MKKLINFLKRKFIVSLKIINEEGIFVFFKKVFIKLFDKIINFINNQKYKDLLNKTLEIAKRKNKILIIISGVKFNSYSGNRNTNIAINFYKKGYFVLFVYFTWNNKEENEMGFINDEIYLLPLRIFMKNINEILESFYFISKKIIILEFPCKESLDIIPISKVYNFAVIYDIKDDWEEFYKTNEAKCYQKSIENFVCKNSDLIISVSRGLKNKFKDYKPFIVPNGFDPDLLNIKTFEIKNLKNVLKNYEICIGYFGNLTNSWFNWNLIIEIAERYPNWFFEIIGYGMPEGLKLPKNINYIGKVKREFLYYYVKKWDVAIIPFKKSILSENSDPLKVYEYLYMKKPVIVYGINHLKNYPYVFVANTIDEFIELIKFSKEINIDDNKLFKFLNNSLWNKRADKIEFLINYISTQKNLFIITNWRYR
ncbi:MAG: hypothetical protein ACP5KX_05800 [Caldisericia bacterium]